MTKNKFLQGFGIVVIILALVRCAFPSIAEQRGNAALATKSIGDNDKKAEKADDSVGIPVKVDSIDKVDDMDGEKVDKRLAILPLPRPVITEVGGGSHPITGVYSYSKTFPDSNEVQLETAKRLGVNVVRDRKEAEARKDELVYIAASPYYQVDKLKNSIPYLIPRASVLLNDIGRNFFDSLYVKGIPLHKMVVSSVLRSQQDLDNLRKKNHNASENSCHLHGTTFDIAYNRYVTVQDPDGPSRREVANDTLKWVLSEVLRDLRTQQRCYVKYEVKQGCFHITTR
ncbi:MAG: hypothetical protein J5548_01000 [Prevotella sp.]|nr:hypothetical protein [Prevotella sp.]